MTGQKCVVVDLDGTMCDIGERDPYSGHMCETDTPIEAMVEIVLALWFRGIKPVFLTGRNETARVPTMEWLSKHTPFKHTNSYLEGGVCKTIPPVYDLLMRDPSDWSKAVDYKRKTLLEEVMPRYEILCAFEDHVPVARMMREELGLTVFLIGEADY